MSRINALIDSIVNLTTEARQRHFQRWPVLGQYIWPNPDPIPQTYNEEISVLKDWLNNRLIWIDNNIPNVGSCYDYSRDVIKTVIIGLYPNPIHDQFLLQVQSKYNQSFQVNVFDATGRKMYAKKNSIPAGNNFLHIASGRWAPGIYFLSYHSEHGEEATIKVLKQ